MTLRGTSAFFFFLGGRDVIKRNLFRNALFTKKRQSYMSLQNYLKIYSLKKSIDINKIICTIKLLKFNT
jgi:hypothetical protein